MHICWKGEFITMLLDFTKLSVLRVDIPVSKYMKKVLDNFSA